MRILVTGAAGFIGSHTAQRFRAMGHEVVGLDNFSGYYDPALKRQNARDLMADGVKVVECDLCTANLYQFFEEPVDMVVHFAARPGIAATSTFQDYLQNNVMATQRLLDVILGLEHSPFFVNIATSSIYGLYATMTEDQAPEPASWYGVTKLAAEQLVLSYCRRGLLSGCSFRLYSVYGPRERPDKLYTRLIDCGLNDKEFPLYSGSEKHLRSFTFVGDIVDGIVSVVDNRQVAHGEVFNLGTEVENSTAKGIATVEELLGKKIRIAHHPPREGDQSRTCANIDKARNKLGYNPTTTLREGLEAQIQWFREKCM